MLPSRRPRRTTPSSLAYHRPMDEPKAPAATTDPTTPAIEAIAAAGVRHRIVRTERASSAEESAAFQGIETRQLLRTIVVRRGDDDYLFVLVPAGRRFDWPKLRALLEVRRMSLPDADEARAVTGYERYTITPFGSTRPWPVIADATIVDEPVVAIGGGGLRGQSPPCSGRPRPGARRPGRRRQRGRAAARPRSRRWPRPLTWSTVRAASRDATVRPLD